MKALKQAYLEKAEKVKMSQPNSSQLFYKIGTKIFQSGEQGNTIETSIAFIDESSNSLCITASRKRNVSLLNKNRKEIESYMSYIYPLMLDYWVEYAKLKQFDACLIAFSSHCKYMFEPANAEKLKPSIQNKIFYELLEQHGINDISCIYKTSKFQEQEDSLEAAYQIVHSSFSKHPVLGVTISHSSMYDMLTKGIAFECGGVNFNFVLFFENNALMFALLEGDTQTTLPMNDLNLDTLLKEIEEKMQLYNIMAAPKKNFNEFMRAVNGFSKIYDEEILNANYQMLLDKDMDWNEIENICFSALSQYKNEQDKCLKIEASDNKSNNRIKVYRFKIENEYLFVIVLMNGNFLEKIELIFEKEKYSNKILNITNQFLFEGFFN